MNQPAERTTTIKACAQLASFRNLSEGECRQVLEIASERGFEPGGVDQALRCIA